MPGARTTGCKHLRSLVPVLVLDLETGTERLMMMVWGLSAVWETASASEPFSKRLWSTASASERLSKAAVGRLWAGAGVLRRARSARPSTSCPRSPAAASLSMALKPRIATMALLLAAARGPALGVSWRA
jgi:hypothetical protein